MHCAREACSTLASTSSVLMKSEPLAANPKQPHQASFCSPCNPRLKTMEQKPFRHSRAQATRPAAPHCQLHAAHRLAPCRTRPVTPSREITNTLQYRKKRCCPALHARSSGVQPAPVRSQRIWPRAVVSTQITTRLRTFVFRCSGSAAAVMRSTKCAVISAHLRWSWCA
jgi:hypothetical protein